MVEEKIIRNLSTTYLVPLIDKVVKINKSFFIGSFIYNEEDIVNSKEDTLFLLFKWDKDYEEELLKNKNVIEHYDIDDSTIMICCKYLIDDLEDVNLIINSKYSEITKENKNKIVSYHGVSMHAKVYQVLFKKEELKLKIEKELDIIIDNKQELGERINIEKEIFRKKEYAER